MAGQFGNYLIIEPIAKGGQGGVYRAQHVTLGHPVAIKVLHDTDHHSVKRFRQEAKVMALLNHKNLPKVIDYGVYRGLPFMVMELIEGDSFKNLLAQGLPLHSKVKIIYDIGYALHYCHDQGVIHRDVKPANIVIEQQTNRPVLIDFGLVKRDPTVMAFESMDQSRFTLTGEIMGTPVYMAPEQLDPSYGGITPLADVYALAATTYNALTGKHPYTGNTPYNVYTNIMMSAPADPRIYDPEMSDAVAELLVLSLSKNLEERPQTTVAFAEQLRQLLSPRKPKRVPRKRSKLPALLAGGILAAGGLAGAGMYAHSVASKRRLARQKRIAMQSPTPKPSQPIVPPTTKPSAIVPLVPSDEVKHIYAEAQSIINEQFSQNYVDTQAYRKALLLLKEAHSLDPNHLEIYKDLARIYYRLTDIEGISKAEQLEYIDFALGATNHAIERANTLIEEGKLYARSGIVLELRDLRQLIIEKRDRIMNH